MPLPASGYSAKSHSASQATYLLYDTRLAKQWRKLRLTTSLYGFNVAVQAITYCIAMADKLGGWGKRDGERGGGGYRRMENRCLGGRGTPAERLAPCGLIMDVTAISFYWLL